MRIATHSARPEAPAPPVPPPAPARSLVREYAEALIVAVLLALVIRTFVVQAFKIPSGSMLPTLQIGDHLLVNKFLYDFTSIHRDDIIVFKYPKDESRDFIKRVIGLPNDTLTIRGTHVFINGRLLDEPYAAYTEPRGLRTLEQDHVGPLIVPPGQLFVMGDNRDNSLDSRFWGFLDEHKVLGKAFLIYFSVRTEDIPYSAVIPSVAYVVVHPSLIRWSRIGRLVH